jgi:DNA-binding IclR family transcriptional regulator
MPRANAQHSGSGSDPKEQLQTVERALELLMHVAAAPDGLTTAHAARACRINRTTAWRLVTTLERRKFLERSPDSRSYQLGPAAVFFSSNRSAEHILVRHSSAILDVLAAETEQTVNLSVPRHLGVVAIFQSDPRLALSVDWIGRLVPLHASSSGKIYLASLDDIELGRLLAKPLDRYTDKTITDPEQLADELSFVRSTGLAYNIGELDVGINGMSAPVLSASGELLAVVSLTGSTHRLPEDRFGHLAPTLHGAIEQLREGLGRKDFPAP